MAYTEKFEKLAEAARARIEAVAAADVDALAKDGAVVLDIRDKEEFDADRIPGAVHLSRGKLEMNIEGVVKDLDALILCYCNANHRGSLSADALVQMGYTKARVIVGGFNAWKAVRDSRQD